MANFSFTINETIPNIVVSENQTVVGVQSTSTTVQVIQNGVALVGTPGPTGPTGPQGPQGNAAIASDAGVILTSSLYNYPSNQVNIGNLGTSDPLGDHSNILFSKFWVHIRQGTSFYLSELLVAYDVDNVYLSENNILDNDGPLGTFTTDWGDGGNASAFQVLYIPTNHIGMTIKIAKMETTYGGPT